jgi:hypothetical protein
MIRSLALWLSLIALPAQAVSDDALHGRWGTAAQCARALIHPTGTVRAVPFEISKGWIRHGDTWCALSSFPPQAQDGGSYTAARALCGEDSALRHALSIVYRTGPPEALTLIWNESLVNGPLARCPEQD